MWEADGSFSVGRSLCSLKLPQGLQNVESWQLHPLGQLLFCLSESTTVLAECGSLERQLLTWLLSLLAL